MKLSFFLNIVTSVIIIIPYFHPTKANADACCDFKTPVSYSAEQIAKINYWTDYFFFLIRPELQGKPIKLSQQLYRREQAGIRLIVRKIIVYGCYWERKNYYLEKISLEDQPERDYWLIRENYLFDGLYAQLTNAIFYAHHPELPKQKSNFKNLNWVTEWNNIRHNFANYQQETNLLSQFIPVCQPRDLRDRIITSEQLNQLINPN
jgi:hypothetical protein